MGIRDTAETKTESTKTGGGLSNKRQAMLAVGAGSAVFGVVMLLMLLAVVQSPPAETSAPESYNGNVPPETYKRRIVVSDCIAAVTMNAVGARELTIQGDVRNTGGMVVEKADLRCRFPTHGGGEASMDLPLVVDSKLDDVGDGPLGPFSVRSFRARIGEFPENLAPQILRAEVVNVRLGNP